MLKHNENFIWMESMKPIVVAVEGFQNCLRWHHDLRGSQQQGYAHALQPKWEVGLHHLNSQPPLPSPTRPSSTPPHLQWYTNPRLSIFSPTIFWERKFDHNFLSCQKWFDHSYSYIQSANCHWGRPQNTSPVTWKFWLGEMWKVTAASTKTE